MADGSARWKGLGALVLVVALGWASSVQAVDDDVGIVGGTATEEKVTTKATGPPEADPGVAAGQPDVLPASYNQWTRYAGSTLRPRVDNVSYTVGGQGGCLYATAGSTSTWFNFPVRVPDGALVKYVRMYANDTSASADCQAYFTVYDLYGNVVVEYGVSSSGSNGTNYWTTEELFIDTDYSQHSYVLHWRPNVLGSSMQLCGFRLYYYVAEIFSHGFEAGDTSGWSAVVN